MAGGGGRARPVWWGLCCHSCIPRDAGKLHGTGDRHLLMLVRDGCSPVWSAPLPNDPIQNSDCLWLSWFTA